MKTLKKHWKLLTILFIASLLRFWKLSEVPVSMFGDELDVGYHAYSLLTTGRDYYGNFLPIHLHSLAEWRTPLYLYTVVPTVALFGISPLGVRIPAAILGVLGVWGIYLLAKQLLGNMKLKLGQFGIGIGEVAALILAISPWHIQYSRAAFEVTELLVFFIFGLYFFFRSLREGKYLWVSAVLLTFTPWIYSTAKLFTPILLIVLFLIWRKEIFSIGKKYLTWAVLAGLIVGVPIAYDTLYGGGAQRFGYVSVFSDPVTVPEVGADREFAARVRGEEGVGLTPTFADRIFYNKYVWWGERIVSNYLQAFSPEFLFDKGDRNLRHSIENVGQMYRVEVVTLLAGIILLATSLKNKKVRNFVFLWLLLAPIPSAITRDGGNHATRLIIMLPPLVMLVSYGIVEAGSKLKSKTRVLLSASYFLLLLFGFAHYQNQYWNVNPWYAERWWHSGWRKAVAAVKEVEDQYDQVIISMSGEPAWIFFAGYYEYPARQWQENFPVGNDITLEGFGQISHIGKFAFGSPQEEIGIYGLPNVLGDETLYLANAKEIPWNLIMEPDRVPAGLSLVESIAYPSGEPVFYLFEKSSNE